MPKTQTVISSNLLYQKVSPWRQYSWNIKLQVSTFSFFSSLDIFIVTLAVPSPYLRRDSIILRRFQKHFREFIFITINQNAVRLSGSCYLLVGWWQNLMIMLQGNLFLLLNWHQLTNYSGNFHSIFSNVKCRLPKNANDSIQTKCSCGCFLILIQLWMPFIILNEQLLFQSHHVFLPAIIRFRTVPDMIQWTVDGANLAIIQNLCWFHVNSIFGIDHKLILICIILHSDV